MSANPKHPLAPTVRTAFVRALDIIKENRGLTLSQMMANAIEEHGILHVLDKIGKYVERDTRIDVTTNGESLVNVLGSIEAGRRDNPSVEGESTPLRH